MAVTTKDERRVSGRFATVVVAASCVAKAQGVVLFHPRTVAWRGEGKLKVRVTPRSITIVFNLIPFASIKN